MDDPEIVRKVAEAVQAAFTDDRQFSVEIASAVLAVAEPLIREQVAAEIEDAGSGTCLDYAGAAKIARGQR